ncbi:acyl-coa synthetase [Malassezia pachydermatis]|uniref:Acyl-coa synthetase n=1 Tax=Malassezia pachydermatis TaxID=77020 RepID=A0A0M8MJS7_9BASI|nr:acyl-coa synthetase [Malassezia pachydermatis]KOS13896.1 acyl-coa synthetase [Malassezia pachydermatis]
MMKALQLERPEGVSKGQPNALVVRDVPIPTVREGMVLVKILAAGLNRRDQWSMLGLYPGLIYENATLGCDGCGIIVDSQSLLPLDNQLYLLVPSRGWESDEAGPEAALPSAPAHLATNEFGGRGFGILGATRQVCGAGTFCEYIAVDKSQLVPAPAHLTAVESATLPCAAVTAYRALFTKGQIQPHHNVLITGIGGGVALQALQMAVAHGANVYVTGGSDSKVERALAMGAKGGALYKDESWTDTIRRQLPSDRPWIDVVIDSAGGDITAKALRAGLRDGGRVVVFGMTAEPKISFTMREALKNVDLLGTTLGSADEFAKSIRFIEQHKIKPSIDTILHSLEEAPAAMELLRKGRVST